MIEWISNTTYKISNNEAQDQVAWKQFTVRSVTTWAIVWILIMGFSDLVLAQPTWNEGTLNEDLYLVTNNWSSNFVRCVWDTLFFDNRSVINNEFIRFTNDDQAVAPQTAFEVHTYTWTPSNNTQLLGGYGASDISVPNELGFLIPVAETIGPWFEGIRSTSVDNGFDDSYVGEITDCGVALPVTFLGFEWMTIGRDNVLTARVAEIFNSDWLNLYASSDGWSFSKIDEMKFEDADELWSWIKSLKFVHKDAVWTYYYYSESNEIAWWQWTRSNIIALVNGQVAATLIGGNIITDWTVRLWTWEVGADIIEVITQTWQVLYRGPAIDNTYHEITTGNASWIAYVRLGKYWQEAPVAFYEVLLAN